MNPWLLIVTALGYTGVLFALAFYGDKRARGRGRPGGRPIVYALSLGVYCTSWTFFGTVGSAATTGWDFLPIYLGPIIALTALAPVLLKLIRVSKRHNITSVADFIASRFGKSQGLAAGVSIMAVVFILPYIALQLKGVAQAFDILVEGPAQSAAETARPMLLADFPLYLALAMAAFAILFGTRHVNSNESHHGIMYAIAFEALVKLSAFLAVGLYVCFSVFNGPGDLLTHAGSDPRFSELFARQPISTSFLTITVLAVSAIFCLPRQFHVAVVENTDPRDLRTARWLFPLYLIAFCLFVIPIAAAGLLLFPTGSVSSDRFVLALPMAGGAHWLTLFAFIGGFSAATGMVIVATVALSIMICNDLIMPVLMRMHWLGVATRHELSGVLLGIRRGVMLALLLGAYGYYRWFGDTATLTSIGLLSFAGVLQLLPALIGGLYIKRISRQGVLAGLATGFLVWGYTLALPNLAHAGALFPNLLADGPFGIGWLNPQALFGWTLDNPLSHGVIWSLSLNIGITALVSALGSRSLIERSQASAFVDPGGRRALGHLPAVPGHATVGDLQVVLGRFLGHAPAQQALADYLDDEQLALASATPADRPLVAYCERLLAGALGGASARLVLESALRRKDLAIDDVVEIIDQTAQAVQFNRSLLQAALDNLSQGVSVIDDHLQLVAWNRRYLSLFDYPEGMIRVGRPVADLIRYNAEHGMCGPGPVQDHVDKRLSHLRTGGPYIARRIRSDGTVLEMHGNPMPGGGFVTTFNDISAHVRSQQALEQANETLEQRVNERTTALSRANAKLSRENRERARLENAARVARNQAERANRSKTRFLAAAGHDLLQPINAARLFASTLRESGGQATETATNIERSLESADGLLAGLLDIAKLDSDAWSVEITDFRLEDMLHALAAEFDALASKRGLSLRMVESSVTVRSDRHLLRRILQNFLSNAVRYTHSGRVLFGCRRAAGAIRIEVWDTGPGIPEAELRNIFEEFHRLDKPEHPESGGLGLGLAIADRIARLLDHNINVRSWPGRGTVFSVTVQRGSANVFRPAESTASGMPQSALAGVHVLCVDDDIHVREGLAAVLKNWSCRVSLAAGRADLPSQAPDILLADYHLNCEDNGLVLIAELRARWGKDLPALLVTAERAESVRRASRNSNVGMLRKPVKPAALRAALTQALREGSSQVA